MRPLVLVGTRKGAFLLKGDPGRRRWRLEGPRFLGSVVHHLVQDPRDGRTLLMAARDGHLGPTVFRSSDLGKTWTEAKQPPAFRKGSGRSVKAVFCLAAGNASEPGVWYAGTVPHGLFRSPDGGGTWEGVSGWHDHPKLKAWAGGDEPPEGPFTHSILVDPRDGRHLYLSASCGGTFESLDGGRDWKPLNLGISTSGILPPLPGDGEHEYGHDPHTVVLSPSRPDRLYQQNHCGIYRMDRPATRWERIGRRMPKAVGDIGFPIVAHPRDPDTAWVIPMDGTSVWPRTSVGGRPAVFVTRDAGRTWERQDRGLPKRAWHTVKRQAFTADGGDPPGLYFGTTSGEIWASRDGGEGWECLAARLPHVYSMSVGRS